MKEEKYNRLYQSAAIEHFEVDDATIAVRKFGHGKPLVLIHGFIVHGYTWRKMLPKLSEHFTCYVLDLPGFGDSKWNSKTDFTFTAQSKRLVKLFKILNLTNYSILAQDTGASIARMVAVTEQNNIDKLVLINTEIPNHRPPFIPMHQFLAKLPLANLMFRSLLKIGFIVRSPLLLKQFFYDRSLLKKPENLDKYLVPLKSSKDKMFGMLEYLKGIEWKIVDDFKNTHKEIKAKTLFVWGENDKTFPIGLAKKMVSQFSVNCEFVSITEASLMPHEEKPIEILEKTIPFLL